MVLFVFVAKKQVAYTHFNVKFVMPIWGMRGRWVDIWILIKTQISAGIRRECRCTT